MCWLTKVGLKASRLVWSTTTWGKLFQNMGKRYFGRSCGAGSYLAEALIMSSVGPRIDKRRIWFYINKVVYYPKHCCSGVDAPLLEGVPFWGQLACWWRCLFGRTHVARVLQLDFGPFLVGWSEWGDQPDEAYSTEGRTYVLLTLDLALGGLDRMFRLK